MQQSLGFEVTLGSSFSGGRECCINLDMHGHASQVCQAECFSTRGLCHLPKRASVVDLRLRDCSVASLSTASFVEQSRLHALVLTTTNSWSERWIVPATCKSKTTAKAGMATQTKQARPCGEIRASTT